ncbi:MAG: hypothetical protein LC623_06270 [Halobacteriales archaeon]|nr:hypothetical protein [Halobacteriales archaeon]
MTPTATAIACLALLASPLLPSASAAESDVQCAHAQVDKDYLAREFDYGTPNEGLLPGFWEQLSVEFVAYLPCEKLANLFGCITQPDTCTAWEQEMVAKGVGYVEDRLATVVARGEGCLQAMTDREVLLAYNTKGITADPPVPAPACAQPLSPTPPPPL